MSFVTVGLWRYWRIGAFPQGRGTRRITTAMSAVHRRRGVGRLGGGFRPDRAMKLLLGGVLIAAAAKTMLARP